MAMMPSVDGGETQRVIVSGGAGDIGAAIVRAGVTAGFRVASLDAAPYPSNSDEIHAVTVDLSDPEACGKAVGETVAELGGVDCLVNCIGYLNAQELIATSPGEVEQVMAANLIAPIQTTRAVLPAMLERGNGLIINICSVWSLGGGSSRSLYSAAKHGLLGFSRSLTAELRGSGITVVALSPGPVKTKMLAQPGVENLYADDELLEVDDIASLVRWVIGAPVSLLHGAHIVFGRSQPAMYVN